jgi:hypothetical protein
MWAFACGVVVHNKGLHNTTPPTILGRCPRADAREDTGLSPLEQADPTAKALGFVTDSCKVDASANPTYKSTHKCGTGAQFQGRAGCRRLQCLCGAQRAARRLTQSVGADRRA